MRRQRQLAFAQPAVAADHAVGVGQGVAQLGVHVAEFRFEDDHVVVILVGLQHLGIDAAECNDGFLHHDLCAGDSSAGVETGCL